MLQFSVIIYCGHIDVSHLECPDFPEGRHTITTVNYDDNKLIYLLQLMQHSLETWSCYFMKQRIVLLANATSRGLFITKVENKVCRDCSIILSRELLLNSWLESITR
jgi:hypothetical protein